MLKVFVNRTFAKKKELKPVNDSLVEWFEVLSCGWRRSSDTASNPQNSRNFTLASEIVSPHGYSVSKWHDHINMEDVR